MTKLIGALTLIAAMTFGPVLALAQDTGSEWQTEPAPQTPQPQETPPPPPPPAEQPPSVQEQPQANAPPAAVPPGQWVYTQQYGWIWMPYSDTYMQVPASGWGSPYAYVYYPAYSCWAWLAAPWIWGVGPWPYFGVAGAVSFGWYGYGWWRYPSHYHYVYPTYPVYAPGYRGWPRPVGAHGTGYAYRGQGFRAPHAGGAGFVARNGGYAFPRPVMSPRGGGFAVPRPGMVAGGGRGGGIVAHGGGARGHGGFGGRR